MTLVSLTGLTQHCAGSMQTAAGPCCAGGGGEYNSIITSYDYDAPISEAGDYGQPGIGGLNKFQVLASVTGASSPSAPCCCPKWQPQTGSELPPVPSRQLRVAMPLQDIACWGPEADVLHQGSACLLIYAGLVP